MSDATGLTNELFYRNGRTPTALQPSDALLVRDIIRKAELQAIEKCARVAEFQQARGKDAAAAIRALKDKP